MADRAVKRRRLDLRAGPFDVNFLPGFYGWYMLPVIVLVLVGSSPGQTAGLAPFVDHLLLVTGLGRENLADLYMLGTICSGLVISRSGGLVDRFGARWVAITAMMTMSLVLLILSIVDRIGHGVSAGVFFLPANVSVGILLVGTFALLRFCGQGLMVLCVQTTLGHWFDRRRGLAVGINSVCFALVGSSAPLLIELLIGEQGRWRFAWQVIAMAILPVMAFVVLMLWRNEPEDIGQFPNGCRPDGDAGTAKKDSEGWTRQEATRTMVFWNVALSQAFIGLVFSAVFFHIKHMGRAVGLSDEQSLLFFIPLSLTVTTSSLIGGLIVDRINTRPLLVLMNLFLVCGLLMLTRFGAGAPFFASALLMGMSMGLSGPVGIATYPRFFGRKHLGAINGVQWSCLVIASALGPSLFARLHEGGDYTRAFLFCLPVPILLGTLGLWMITPTRKS